jgi:type II secretory pathway pseudopilin PulG
MFIRYVKITRSFTLVEVLVAIWILSTTLVALLGIYMGNIKYVKKIDENSISISLALSVSQEKYLSAKYNVEVKPTEVPDGFKVDFEIVNISNLLPTLGTLLANVNLPIIPLLRISAPSGGVFEIFGKPNPEQKISQPSLQQQQIQQHQQIQQYLKEF